MFLHVCSLGFVQARTQFTHTHTHTICTAPPQDTLQC